MIPPPPPDRALPGLPTALSGAAMQEILAPKLGPVRSCEPCYVRYKPATNCIVQYRLGLEETDTIAHVKLYADGRADRLWARGAVQRLATKAGSGAAHLPEIGAVLQLYPVDAALPALTYATSPAGRRHVLGQVFEHIRSTDEGAELLRYKPARKALLRYEAAGGTVYAKLHARERGALMLRVDRALRAAGVPTARPLAYFPSLRLVAHEEVRGTPLRTLHGTPAFERGARAAAAALARLHAVTPVAGLVRHGWAHEAAAVTASARAIGGLRPDLAAEAAAVAQRAVEALGELPPGSATLHGDFYDDQVLATDDGAILLDLEGIECGHPLLDVANFLAHLSVRDEHDPVREAFLDAYAPPSRGAMPLLEGAALLKLAVAPFRRLEPDWPEAVERRLRLAARRLGEQRRPPRRAHRLDPALPQLAALRDPALVGDALTDVYGEPVEVATATVVRHKLGRRCTLRYDLLIGRARRPERLYGKTFASERGPRVHRRLAAIAAARACGTTALPEPVAYLGPLRLLLQREVAGIPVRAALLAGDRALAVAIAEAVGALHGSDVELDRRHRLEDELEALRTRVDRLAVGTARARACLARIEAAPVSEWRLRPVHRDFYHDQLLVVGGRLGMLDFDDAALSEPAVDVANFLAHLRLLALQEPARRDAIEGVAGAFRARAHELDPALDAPLVRLLESATLLRLACIHEPFAQPLIDEAEALLSHAPRGRRTQPDPALDGDRVLALVADAVEQRAGARPHACRAFLLRRKKGRAVVRYELDTDGGPHAIVGKWFADDRGLAVVGVLAALRAHGFAAGAYAVPAAIAYVPESNALFTEAAAGPSVRAALETNPAAAARAGAWLARFHTCGAVLARSSPPSAWAGNGGEHAALTPLAARLAPVLRAAADPALPVHFDYSSADVLVPEDGPTVVVDFDDAAMGDPAFDVANFGATLTLRGWRRAGDGDAFAAARQAFADGYTRHAALPPASPAVEAAVWLRLADRCLKRGIGGDLWRFAADRAAACLGQGGG